jgi:hypothetical protein
MFTLVRTLDVSQEHLDHQEDFEIVATMQKEMYEASEQDVYRSCTILAGSSDAVVHFI